MRVLCVVSFLLCLAACSPKAPAPVAAEAAASSLDAPPAPATPRVLAGVDLDQPLQISGTEPFWHVAVTDSGMVWSSPDGPDRSFPKPVIVMADNSAVMTGGGISIALKGTTCSDGMSDRAYPLAAKVVIDGQTYAGCAAPAKPAA